MVLQGEVEKFYGSFINTVAEGRGKKTSAKAARDTEARTYIGRDAIDARLVDDVGTFDDVLAELSRTSTRKSQSARSSRMADDAVNCTLEVGADGEPRASFEFAGIKYSEARDLAAAATQAGVKQGAQAQLDRILAVLDDERSKGRERACVKIACKAPDMNPEDVCSLAAETTVEQPRPLAERAKDTGADAIDGTVTAQPKADSGWDSVIAERNERTRKEAGRAKQPLASDRR
jgi:hypothetical protein